jgi:Prokaryotic homologs of the JAB domain
VNDTDILRGKIMAAHEAVARGEQGAKARLEGLQAEFRSGGHTIVRDNFAPGAAQLRGGSVAAPQPVRAPQSARAPKREVEDWVLGADQPLPFGHSYREVELREQYVNFKVTLTPYVRQRILDEIRRVHRDAGEEIEMGGWLFAHYLPRLRSDSIQIVHVVGPGADARASRTRLIMGDPLEAMTEVHAVGLGHLRLVGDWHAHCVRGSDLPSQQDAIAWAGTMDSLARSAYVSLVVAPHDNGYGWSMPMFSAWITERVGVPSRPICGRARVEGA